MTFDQSPLVRWQIELDSQGTDFRVDMVFETAHHGSVLAGMPFDLVQRPTAERDLLPHDLPSQLAKVLLGQRELGAVNTFPFHDFVAVGEGASAAAIFARGLHAYQADENGRVAVTLRRSVEWLTKPDLQHRAGDAGPLFYVPDARCERKVRHELAAAVGEFAADKLALHRLNAGYQCEPLIVKTDNTAGAQTVWQFLQEDLPMSSLHIIDDKPLVRFFNPTNGPLALHRMFQRTDVWGRPIGRIDTVQPKDIATLLVEQPMKAVDDSISNVSVRLANTPRWRVGDNHGQPESKVIEQLYAKIAQLQDQLEQIEDELTRVSGSQYYRLQHQYYVFKRELYEYKLSARLNELKLANRGQLDQSYLYEQDAQVAEIGFQLNQMRIKRRIFDYIIESV
jgi:hypothetical protein